MSKLLQSIVSPNSSDQSDCQRRCHSPLFLSLKYFEKPVREWLREDVDSWLTLIRFKQLQPHFINFRGHQILDLIENDPTLSNLSKHLLPREVYIFEIHLNYLCELDRRELLYNRNFNFVLRKYLRLPEAGIYPGIQVAQIVHVLCDKEKLRKVYFECDIANEHLRKLLSPTNDVEEELDVNLRKLESNTIGDQFELKVKLIITETAFTDGEQRLRKFLSPILYTMGATDTDGLKFGMFHTAIIVGPWYLEWTNSSIVIPKQVCVSSNALVSMDLNPITVHDLGGKYRKFFNDEEDSLVDHFSDLDDEEVEGEEEEVHTVQSILEQQRKNFKNKKRGDQGQTKKKKKSWTIDEVKEILAQVVCEWNSEYTYSRIPREKKKFGNCQSFVCSVFKRLGIEVDFDVDRYIQRRSGNLHPSPRSQQHTSQTSPIPKKKKKKGNNETSVFKREGALRTFIRRISEKGHSELLFTPGKEFIDEFRDVMELKKYETFKVKGGHFKFIFRTHRELDDFCYDIVAKKIKSVHLLRSRHASAFSLLKSFDRAFWLRFLRNQKDTRYTPSPPKQGRKYGSLMFQTGCIFQDPRDTLSYAM